MSSSIWTDTGHRMRNRDQKTHPTVGPPCGRTRRQFLWEVGAGFAGVALAGLLGDDGFLGTQAYAADGKTAFNPLTPKPPHLAPKAKSVIFLYMYGGPSHIDT